MSEHEGTHADEPPPSCMIIVEGVTQKGRKFRPSDWVERFAGNAATFGADNRLHYSSYIKPTVYNGVKGLLVDPLLRETRPELFRQLVSFARENHLRVPETCGVPEFEDHMAEAEGERDS
ncbi:DUF3579 domain-containing protein [Thiohalorhabdus sp.]|uniref:DUF3579 domain-containing protein n=1 Tax=Thiohalorhabdus sp. TaxID=3094134 RepID=UPI002FC398ED